MTGPLASLRDFEAEHARLAVDARRTPGRVLQRQPMYQCAQAGIEWRSTSTAALREPGPIAPKTGLVPADHRLGFHEDEHLGPSQPKPPQGEPEQSVGGNDSGTPTTSGKRGQLLPERQVLEHKLGMGEEDGTERADRQYEAADHDGSSVHATGRNVNHSRSDEFWRGTSDHAAQKSLPSVPLSLITEKVQKAKKTAPEACRYEGDRKSVV